MVPGCGTLGVPQGSILGPMIFISYFNNFSQCFRNSKFLLYADLKVFSPIKSVGDCDTILQHPKNSHANR